MKDSRDVVLEYLHRVPIGTVEMKLERFRDCFKERISIAPLHERVIVWAKTHGLEGRYKRFDKKFVFKRSDS